MAPTVSESEQGLILQGTSAAGANLGKPLHGTEEARDPNDYEHCLSNAAVLLTSERAQKFNMTPSKNSTVAHAAQP